MLVWVTVIGFKRQLKFNHKIHTLIVLEDFQGKNVKKKHKKLTLAKKLLIEFKIPITIKVIHNALI